METISETRGSRPLTALRNMAALYQSRSCHREEETAADVSDELPFSSTTTPHSINDILARSTRPSSALLPRTHASALSSTASLSASLQTNTVVTKSPPIIRLASPVGLAGTASPSMYWAAAAAASLISPSLCWNQRGKWPSKARGTISRPASCSLLKLTHYL